jgi:oligoendopeptidase F
MVQTQSNHPDSTINLPSWDLSDISNFFADKDISQLLESFKQRASEFAKFKSELFSEDGTFTLIEVDRFIFIVRQKQALLQDMSLVGSFVSLQAAKNTRDEELKKLERQISTIGTDISNTIRFFRLWFIRLPESDAKRYADALGDDSYSYMQMHTLGKYVLSDELERAISLKESAVEELCSIFDSFCSSLTFDVKGEKKSLQQMRSLLSDESRELRKLAHELTTQSYNEHMYLVSNIYTGIVRDYHNECILLRGYENSISVRALREGISVDALNALFSCVRRHAHLFHRYFKIKAKLLDLEKLEVYDLHASVPHSFHKVSYSDAMIHLHKLATDISSDEIKFDNMVTEIEPHIDATIMQHKRGGAFCMSPSCGINPYVFMQYEGNFSDMMTLVHEMGHAVHGYVGKDLSVDSHHATIGVCESASTFFEELLLERLIDDSNDSDKIALLAQSLHEAFSTIVLQAYVAISENTYHDMIPKGATYDELTDVWHALCIEMYGDSVVFDRSYAWAYRPHIYHSPFYCYNYAIGNILALLLLNLKKTLSPSEFAAKYHSYLAVGGRASVVDTARVLGVDLTDSKTWDSAFEILRERLELLEKLVG